MRNRFFGLAFYSSPYLLAGMALLLLLVNACSSARYVPEEKYLLKENEIKVTTNRLSKSEMDVYFKQHPNRRTFLNVKFPLFWYNISSADCKFFVNKWLRSWGEAPVVLDTTLIAPTVKSLGLYVESMGYYDYKISDTVAYNQKKRKATVVYNVDVSSPIRIRKLSYEIADPAIRELVLADSTSTLLHVGRVLSEENLTKERARITSMLRNKGYYEFRTNFITFEADTTIGHSRADLKLKLANVQVGIQDNEPVYRNHTKFVVKNIYVNTSYDLVEAYRDSSYVRSFDTLDYKGVGYLYSEKLDIRPSVINRINRIALDSLYSERDVNDTYTNLSNLSLFKTITIRFNRATQDSTATEVPLSCEILLSPTLPQGYRIDMEVSSNSSGLWSFAPAIGYNHQNLFKGAEYFQLNVRGAYQQYIPRDPAYKSSRELGISSSIRLPRFLIPFSPKLSRRNLPHTTFGVLYGYQERPDYTRQTGGGTFGYSWKSSDRSSFTYNPVEVSVVRMQNIDSAFYATLNDPYMRNLYENHFIGGATASYEFRSAMVNEQHKRTHFLRIGADVGGNLISLFNSVLPMASDGSHTILGSSYAQYAKADINYSMNHRINRLSNIVYHGFMGVGKPYGNSIALPLEKMFFAGGANSLRGWQARTVGPGSAPLDTTFYTPNQVGDMMLEGNVEYRFKLISLLEGAVFLDAGNIWSLSPDNSTPGASFKFNQFYKDIALNTGLGLRLNLSFLVIRVDVGFKIHDPARVGSDRWLSPSSWFHNDNNAWHFALNYPF